MLNGIRFITALFIVSVLSLYPAMAQPERASVKETVKAAKPYRIHTAGKSVTIKSTKDIRNVMVWTAGGHRVLEEKNINASVYNFKLTVSSKVYFVMVQMVDGRSYSEKIGI